MNRYQIHKTPAVPEKYKVYFSRDEYPESHAVECWVDDSDPNRIITYSIVFQGDMGFYCGYARLYTGLSKKKIEAKLGEGFSVHGGETYMKYYRDSYVIGFDCAHWGDKEDPEKKNMAWLKKECEKLGEQIKQKI